MLGIFNKIFNQKKSTIKNLDVLLIEDSDVDVRIVLDIITKQGWKIRVAGDGQKGVDAAIENPPDIIIMDCEMPVLGGLDACKLLKENGSTKDIPVIFLTSNDSPGNIVDCFEVDAENYIAKPVNPKVLVSFINKAVEEDAAVE